MSPEGQTSPVPDQHPVCGRDPVNEGDWVTLQAATTLPFHLVLPQGNYYALRVKRDNTTRPISAVVNSGDYSR